MRKWLLSILQLLVQKSTNKLVTKLILLFTSIIILVVVSLTYISYRMIEKESVDNGIASNMSNLRLVNKNVAGYFEEIELLSLPGLRYEEIMNSLQNESNDFSSRLYLEDYLRSLYYSRTDIEGVYLYLVDEQKYYYISQSERTVKVAYDEQAQIPKQAWYREVQGSTGNYSIQPLLDQDEQPAGYELAAGRSYMAYHRVLRTLLDREPKAVLSFLYLPAGLDVILRDVPLTQRERLLLLDANGAAYYMNDKPFYEQQRQSGYLQTRLEEQQSGLSDWSDGQDVYLVINDVQESQGWRLMKSVPYDEIYASAQTNRNLGIGIGLLFLLLSVLLVTLTSNAITRPLMNLSRKMNRFSLGHFDVEAKVKGRDEIARLAQQFNQMVIRTNELINERYKMKLAQNNAILKALEAEINPHFLYNALQAISTKALKSGAAEVTTMVEALALTLRYCINGKDNVTLREEIQHIENYLVIQKARFGDRLRIELELDAAVYELAIPKLSIQTLVENAVKHALEKVAWAVTIRIAAQIHNGDVIITVSDDGPGMLPEQVSQLLESLQIEWEDWRGDSIGLKNLHTRLKLIYGQEAQLLIESDESGTQLHIIIPEGGRNADVSNLDY